MGASQTQKLAKDPSRQNLSGSQKNQLQPGLFAGQAVGIKDVHDDNWLVSFMDDDLGYFDLKTRVLEPPENPFGPKVLPM
jgi:hypothetical protein